ncbi:DUF3253 domain-containing protein [Glutamicibacter sp.]|uniref:DUF3253 domain-containing protein n=1 Tax=Glutamicibacter sp. TaxID=1931995 RepID=UPI002B4A21B0|nr:DUF3253 domain-containing protein [Glutamicibacter sp.]HJX78281.1 DUF3253 domain-containing protein [Glutamicibacter sp.]
MTPPESSPESTPDGHYLIIKGRKWRASNPSIPPKLRLELVDELMSARRAVKDGSTGVRKRVNDAKVALGERGQPWWEDPDPTALNERITATIRALLRKRAGASICPSDVARVVGGPEDAWRKYMNNVRQITAEMAAAGEVKATQKGKTVEADNVRGPIRINRTSPEI